MFIWWRPGAYKFQSTPPARGATGVGAQRMASQVFISIHAPREGGDSIPAGSDFNDYRISIHAPREGGDVQIKSKFPVQFVISIHAPREGGDRLSQILEATPQEFQSTPPARGATRTGYSSDRWDSISIHAPREGGDAGLS